VVPLMRAQRSASSNRAAQGGHRVGNREAQGGTEIASRKLENVARGQFLSFNALDKIKFAYFCRLARRKELNKQ